MARGSGFENVNRTEANKIYSGVSGVKVALYAKDITLPVSRRLPIPAARAESQVRSCGNWGWRKWNWRRLSPNILVSPASSNSTDCSTLVVIYHLGLIQ
jgi:hypothetical protein